MIDTEKNGQAARPALPRAGLRIVAGMARALRGGPGAAHPPGLGWLFRRFRRRIMRERTLLAGSSLAMLLEIGLRLLEPWPLKIIFDRLTAPAGGTSVPTWTDRFSPAVLLTLAPLALILIAVLQGSAAYLNKVGFALAAGRVLTDVRADLYRHVQRLSLSFHTRAKAGDLLSHLTGDIAVLREVTVTAVLPLAISVATLIGMLGLMLWLNWQLALLAFTSFPLFVLAMIRLSGRIRDTAREERRREGNLAASAAQSFSAIKVVQALALEPEMERDFASQNHESLSASVQGKRLSALLERSVDVVIAAGTAVVLWWGARLVLRGQLSAGDLLVFTTYVKNAYRPVRDLAKYIGRITKASASAERIAALLHITPDIRDRRGAIAAPQFRGAVRFEHASFSYEPGRMILDRLDLEVQPGQRVALVGESGSGKSTLVSLLLRLYEPTEGRVLIDGRDIRDYTIESLRRQIGIVLQESVLFAMSVRDNIALGAPGVTESEIEAAARLANAHDFILELPQGYDTLLGERGATLSGGQRQRIAIARAAVRKAPILILDEPTTGLDNESARLVSEALERLSQQSTTFIIAHDLHTIERADQILFLEQGRVVEQGTHDELIARDGKYAALYASEDAREQADRAEESDVISG